jgi:hypothetical protein
MVLSHCTGKHLKFVTYWQAPPMLAAFTIEYYLENSLCIFLNYSVSYSDEPDRWCNGKRARLECDGVWV